MLIDAAMHLCMAAFACSCRYPDRPESLVFRPGRNSHMNFRKIKRA
jgi:hypothetical protein